jgi:hypothetical protein
MLQTLHALPRLFHSLKEVGAVRTIMLSGFHAAALETCAQNRTGRDHSARAFPRVPHLRARLVSPVLRFFRTGNPCGAYGCVRKEDWLMYLSFRMAGLLLGMTHFIK